MDWDLYIPAADRPQDVQDAEFLRAKYEAEASHSRG